MEIAFSMKSTPSFNGGADFYGKSLTELRSEFKQSLETFLAVCEENNIKPMRVFSGKFNVRINEEMHTQIFYQAASSGKSINQWISNTLGHSLDITLHRQDPRHYCDGVLTTKLTSQARQSIDLTQQ
tara:strand:- start:27 stop:407 length:381 start_codon:yes stop_codon:yes gene_type:complete